MKPLAQEIDELNDELKTAAWQLIAARWITERAAEIATLKG